MLYDAEILIASRPLLSLEPADVGALERLKAYFGFTTELADERRDRLAAVLAQTLAALKSCGLDDAVFAACDGQLCFVDRVGVADDVDALTTEVEDESADFEVLRLFITEPVDPARELRLGVDVELHRVVPVDGYALRLRIHGLINALASRPGESWASLRKRVDERMRALAPARSFDGHADLPAEFSARVEGLRAAMSAEFSTEQIDVAQRAAIVIPRHPEMSELPPPGAGAGFFTELPGLGASLRYAFAWPELHWEYRYAHTLILDGHGLPVFAAGPTPVVAGTPAGFLEAGIAPVHPPTPDVVAFSGHEWDADARAEHLIAADASCEGVEGSIALRSHERRKFDCGTNGPARLTAIGQGVPTLSEVEFHGDIMF